MDEKWKDIVGYEGRYKISNNGKVKSIDRIVYRKNQGSYKLNGRIISQNAVGKEYKSSNHYLGVNLWCDGLVKCYRVHRLVAEAFIPNPKGKPFVNHKNGIKTDNRAINLEWSTDSENKTHASKNGLMSRGEKSGTNVLTKKQVLEIRCAYNLGCFSYREIAEAYNVHTQTIAPIIRGETWVHLI